MSPRRLINWIKNLSPDYRSRLIIFWAAGVLLMGFLIVGILEFGSVARYLAELLWLLMFIIWAIVGWWVVHHLNSQNRP